MRILLFQALYALVTSVIGLVALVLFLALLSACGNDPGGPYVDGNAPPLVDVVAVESVATDVVAQVYGTAPDLRGWHLVWTSGPEELARACMVQIGTAGACSDVANGSDSIFFLPGDMYPMAHEFLHVAQWQHERVIDYKHEGAVWQSLGEELNRRASASKKGVWYE